MVLQELDKLKSQHGQKNVSAMARQAIRFIRDTFTEGNAKFQGILLSIQFKNYVLKMNEKK